MRKVIWKAFVDKYLSFGLHSNYMTTTRHYFDPRWYPIRLFWYHIRRKQVSDKLSTNTGY